MNIENIQCFISLSECLNFTKAAEKEHMTQTSMSRKISSLEDELGVLLFYRDNHQVVLTEAGQEFYYQAQRLLEIYTHSVHSVQNIHNGFVNAMKIGVGIYEHELLHPFLSQYTLTNPSVKISCTQYGYRELLKRFEQNLLDIIISSDQFFTDIPKDDLDMFLVHDQDWCLGIHKDHPLAAEESIDYQALENEVLISMYDGSISQIIDHYLPFFKFRDIIHVNSYETKIMMIQANLGVGIMPAFVSLDSRKSVCLKPFSAPYKPRNFYILCRKNNPNQYVREFFKSYVEFWQKNAHPVS